MVNSISLGESVVNSIPIDEATVSSIAIGEPLEVNILILGLMVKKFQKMSLF